MHNNLGDQAIVHAQINFLSDFMPDYNIKIIYEGLYHIATKNIRDKIQKDNMIAIHGGGNMGDVWREYEVEREAIVAKFANVPNKIISFPQSYNFTNSFEGMALRNQANNVYSQANNLILFARESLSLVASRILCK